MSPRDPRGGAKAGRGAPNRGGNAGGRGEGAGRADANRAVRNERGYGAGKFEGRTGADTASRGDSRFPLGGRRAVRGRDDTGRADASRDADRMTAGRGDAGRADARRRSDGSHDRGYDGGGGRDPGDDGAHGDGGDDREPRRSLATKGARANDPGSRVVYGVGPVRELVQRRPSTVKAIWVDPHRAGRSVRDPVADIVVAARAAEIRVEDRDRPQLDRAAIDGVHQGVIAWLGPFEYADLDSLLVESPALVVALDGIEDPRNLGAILRSAFLMGAGGVIIPEHRAAQVTPLVAKASAGASELIPIACVGNLARTLAELRERGLWRVAVHASDDAKPIAQLDGTLPLCVVLGAEGSGVRPLVAKNCDFHAVIPMARSAVGSFNVSVAASIALYEIRRQRDVVKPT